MVEGINNLLENNDIQVRIGSEWYRLEELGPIGHNEFPIVVTDESGGEWEYDMADIEEFDSTIEAFRNMESTIIGEA